MSEHETPEGGLGGPADAADDPTTAAVMQTLAPTLRDAALWMEPPATLADSIVAAIAAERGAPPAAAVPAEPAAGAVPPPPLPAAPADELSQLRARRAERRRRPVLWGALASAAAIVAIAVGFVAVRDDDGGDVADLALTGTELSGDASASADITEFDAGVAIKLDIDGLPPAPEGQYYAGWVRSEAGDLVGIGSFHIRGGDATVTLWSGVPLAEYPTVSVTIQTEGAGEGSSGEVVLRGTLGD